LKCSSEQETIYCLRTSPRTRRVILVPAFRRERVPNRPVSPSGYVGLTRAVRLFHNQRPHKTMSTAHCSNLDARTSLPTHSHTKPLISHEGSNYDARTTRPHTQSEGPRQAVVSSGTLFQLWRRDVVAFAPTPGRCRSPEKRRRFEESTSLLIVETGLRFVTLVLSLVEIIMNTIHQWILKRARLYGSVQTICAHQLLPHTHKITKTTTNDGSNSDARNTRATHKTKIRATEQFTMYTSSQRAPVRSGSTAGSGGSGREF
jgi:hypothetical protein